MTNVVPIKPENVVNNMGSAILRLIHENETRDITFVDLAKLPDFDGDLSIAWGPNVFL
jgi:hypothetical protein